MVFVAAQQFRQFVLSQQQSFIIEFQPFVVQFQSFEQFVFIK